MDSYLIVLDLVTSPLLSLYFRTDHCSVWTFCCVFKHIFCSKYATTFFHIDVAVVAERQFWVVGHHKTIVGSEGYISAYKCDSASSICRTATAVGCIGTIGVHHSVGQERLGETFCALALFHAGSSWIEITTGTMDHVGGNNILKLLSLFHLLIGQTWLIGI